MNVVIGELIWTGLDYKIEADWSFRDDLFWTDRGWSIPTLEFESSHRQCSLNIFFLFTVLRQRWPTYLGKQIRFSLLTWLSSSSRLQFLNSKFVPLMIPFDVSSTCDVIKPRYSLALMSSRARPDQKSVVDRMIETSLKRHSKEFVQKFVGSNPRTEYWMDIISHNT